MRTNSIYSGDGYGYGWFQRAIGGQEVHYAWGFGGQMLYIVPDLGLTVVMTSREDDPSARNGHRDDLHALLGRDHRRGRGGLTVQRLKYTARRPPPARRR